MNEREAVSLREEVANAIYRVCDTDTNGNICNWPEIIDAALSVIYRRLETVSEGMRAAGFQANGPHPPDPMNCIWLAMLRAWVKEQE